MTLALPTLPVYRLAAAAGAAVLAVVAIALYGSPAEALGVTLAGTVLIICATTDLERRIIPNRIVLPAIPLALTAHAVDRPASLLVHVGMALGLGLLFILPRFLNRAAMGMGDVKLVMFLGAALGTGALGALMLSCVAVLPVALAIMIRSRGRAKGRTLPFGPFLAFGGIVILLLPGIVH